MERESKIRRAVSSTDSDLMYGTSTSSMGTSSFDMMSSGEDSMDGSMDDGDYDGYSSGTSLSNEASSNPSSSQLSAFARPSYAFDVASGVGARATLPPLPGEEEGLACRRAWQLQQRQLAAGIQIDNNPTDSLLRLFPFDLEPERLWEVMTSMNIVDKVRMVCVRGGGKVAYNC